MIKEMLIAGCGGFIGTCLRFLINKLCAFIGVLTFPIGTFAVNIIGCILIGVLSVLTERYGLIGHNCNLFLITGICGGFTTFSTFSNEILIMGVKGTLIPAILYAVLSVVLGVGCVWLGRYFAG